MLKNVNPYKVLFLDIETVPEAAKWDDISQELQDLWAKKTFYRRDKENRLSGKNHSYSDYFQMREYQFRCE